MVAWGGRWVSCSTEREQFVGLTREVYKAGLMVEMSKLTGEMEVLGLTKGEIDWLWVKWSRMTLLRFRPGWKGVEVVRWLVEARWRVGDSVQSKS